MNSGFYNAAIQMSTGSVQDMEVHTENLSHSTMPGYKRLETSRSSFADVMQDHVDIEADVPKNNLVVNHTQGALRGTGSKLDFAIEGEGFFVVSDGEREFLTRNGGFHVTGEGHVVNSLGMRLQTTSGDLQIPPGNTVDQFEIDDQLTLKFNKRAVGVLKLAAVDDPSQLEQAGTTLFLNTNNQAEREPDSTVLNGYLEQSNTSVFEEMVGIMTTLRNYEACQKMLKTVDNIEEKMMSKLS